MTLPDWKISGEGALYRLGLVTISDRLAEQVLPALRARMSRPRFLTAVAACTSVWAGLARREQITHCNCVCVRSPAMGRRLSGRIAMGLSNRDALGWAIACPACSRVGAQFASADSVLETLKQSGDPVLDRIASHLSLFVPNRRDPRSLADRVARQ